VRFASDPGKRGLRHSGTSSMVGAMRPSGSPRGRINRTYSRMGSISSFSKQLPPARPPQGFRAVEDYAMHKPSVASSRLNPAVCLQLKTLSASYSVGLGRNVADHVLEEVSALLTFLGLEQTTWPLKGGCGIPWLVVDPAGAFKHMWDGLTLMCVVYDVFVIPYRFCFAAAATGPWLIWETFETTFFMVDVFVSMITAYSSDFTGVLVIDPRRCMMHYFIGWFTFDAVVAFPYDWVLGTGGDGRSDLSILRIFKYARFLRVLRLLKVKARAKTSSLMRMIEESALLMTTVGLLKIWVMAILPCHFSACLWYYIGFIGFDKAAGPDSVESWLKQLPEDVQAMVPDPDGTPHGWDAVNLYQVAAYFVLVTMTTVGYGDMSPRNQKERWFCTFLLFESMVVFSTFVGLMNSVLIEIYAASSYGRHRLIQLAQYMRWRNVTGELKHSIIDHMKHIWEENHSHLEYEEQLCKDLSPSLRTNLMWSVFGPVLVQAPFLCWMNQTALREICFFASTRIMESGDVVFSVGEIIDVLFCVTNGKVRLFRSKSTSTVRDGAIDAADLELTHARVVAGIPVEDHADTRHFQVRRVKRHVSRLQRLLMGNYTTEWLYQVSAEDCKRQQATQATQLKAGRDYFDTLHQASREAQRREMELQMRGSPVAAASCAPRGGQVESRILEAPGFFGESVLWNAGLDRTVYGCEVAQNCICVTRSEFVTVERRRLADVAARYPALVSNFEHMRREVFADADRRAFEYYGRKILNALRAKVARKHAKILSEERAY